MRALLVVLLGLAVLGELPTTTSASDETSVKYVYDGPAIARLDVPLIDGAETRPTRPTDVREASAPPSVDGRGTSTTFFTRNNATEAVDDLVRFDPGWVSRQIVGWNLRGSTGCAATPGGNALSVHVAERTFLGGAGSALIGPSRIGDILWQGTRVMYRGVNGTVKVGAANLCGMCFVVVDVHTGTHVASVMVPR